jgi:hypothetical protein
MNNTIATHQIGPDKEIEGIIEVAELSTPKEGSVSVGGNASIAFSAKNACSSKINKYEKENHTNH